VEKSINTQVSLQMHTWLALHDVLVQLKNGKPIHPKENDRATKLMSQISDILDTFYASNQKSEKGDEM
jgi:cell division FtsZ-interacting protein ZapD